MCLLLAALLGGIAAASPGRDLQGTEGAGAEQTARSDHAATGADPASPHTTEACTALVTDVVGLVPAGDNGSGLETAIGSVLAACEHNPQAPGLLVALRHLEANLQREAAREHAGAAHGKDGEHGGSGTYTGGVGHGRPADPGSQGVSHAASSHPSS